MGKRNVDLGRDPLGKLLFRLAIPSMTAQLVNILYNMVDRIYIGHIPGEGAMALTGLGLCFPVIMLILAFGGLVGLGGAPRAAIFMGKGQEKDAEKTLGSCIAMLAVCSVILTVFFQVFAEDILYLFGASDTTIGYALPYMRIYIMGTVFVQFSMGLNPFITTQGFASHSMMTVIISAVLNIILDPIFIYACGMGVQGAAFATILSQAVSAVWVLCFLGGKRTKLKIRRENLVIRKEYVLPVIALGISPFVMQSTESLISISFNSSLSKYGGDMAVGAMAILSSIMQLIWQLINGLTQGAQPVIGFNFGAGNKERVRNTFRILLVATLGLSVTAGGLVLLFPEVFVKIFNKESAELVDITVWAIRIFMPGTLVLGIQSACQQTFLALGQAKISLFLACMRKIVLMIPFIFLLPLLFEDKVFAVFLAEPLSDVGAVISTAIAFWICFPKILEKGPIQKTLHKE